MSGIQKRGKDLFFFNKNYHFKELPVLLRNFLVKVWAGATEEALPEAVLARKKSLGNNFTPKCVCSLNDDI